MAIFSLFTKFKGLGPVFVVGSAVIVTIKLLTTQTHQTEEIIQVKAEEDIKTEDYKDDIKEPEAPPPAEEAQKEEEEVKPPAQEEQEPEQEIEEEEENEKAQDDSESSEKTEEDSAPQEQQKQEQPPASNRKFNSTLMGQMLGRLFAKGKDK